MTSPTGTRKSGPRKRLIAAVDTPRIDRTELTLLFDGASARAVVHGGSVPATRRAVSTILAGTGI